MLPMWLVYMLMIVLIILDVLFVLEVAVVGVFLIAYILFNIATALLGRKINRYIAERLERARQEAALKSENRGKVAGLVKTAYSILYLAYRAYDVGTALIVALIAFALLIVGVAGLAFINIALFWLLNAYVL